MVRLEGLGKLKKIQCPHDLVSQDMLIKLRIVCRAKATSSCGNILPSIRPSRHYVHDFMLMKVSQIS
jgi:hypothetical protein